MSDSEFARGTRVAGETIWPNNRTRVACVGGVFVRSPLVGLAAMERYELWLRKAVLQCPRDHVFVAMIDSNGSAAKSQVLAPGESVVFGRHEQVGLQHYSQDVSLRHVAVAVAPASTETEALVRMWDLATGRPFLTEDGQATEALTADGPVFATVGSVLIAVIPLASLPKELPTGTDALWNSLPSREVISRVATGSVVQPLAPPPQTNFGQGTRVNRVRSLLPIENCDPAMAIGTLTLSTSAGSRKFFLSAEALERGVLLGRYGRCLTIEGKIEDVSRVHLLLSQVGPDIMALDMASSVGTFDLAGHSVDSIVLGETTEMLLADSLRMHWQARTLPRA